uniref:ATPdependent DNA helicase PIF1like [Metaseiulus occidentalis] n=1 Tax=Lepeophtheirus salmonis TaxID=72036 RepID=A0A0K2VIG9_LEPSM
MLLRNLDTPKVLKRTRLVMKGMMPHLTRAIILITRLKVRRC